MTDETDEIVSQRAAAGCRASFSMLITRHYDRIYRLAWRWTGSRAEAEDIAQDVCIKLAHAIRTYRGDAAFTTWLYRIVYTTTADRRRSTQRTETVEPSKLIVLADAAMLQGPTDESEASRLWIAVKRLPPQQRDAVTLVYGEEMSHAAAASIMGCSEKTVSWHIHEAKKRLRALIEAVG